MLSCQIIFLLLISFRKINSQIIFSFKLKMYLLHIMIYTIMLQELVLYRFILLKYLCLIFSLKVLHLFYESKILISQYVSFFFIYECYFWFFLLTVIFLKVLRSCGSQSQDFILVSSIFSLWGLNTPGVWRGGGALLPGIPPRPLPHFFLKTDGIIVFRVASHKTLNFKKWC